MNDVVIIGAGPSGIFCAYELIEKNPKLKVVVVDEGKNIKDRVCPMNKFGGACRNCNPCNILSGFGGGLTWGSTLIEW